MTKDKLPDSINEAVNLLDELNDDNSLPKTIRVICEEAKNILLSPNDIKLKIDAAMQKLDSLSDDVNMSTYARTQVWNIISLLESA